MNSFVAFKDSIAGYSSTEFCSDEMCNLGNFFSTDYEVFKRIDFVENWLNDSNKVCISGNVTYLEKDDETTILIGDLFDKEPATNLEISCKNFIKLLIDWEKVVDQKPKEIVITKEGDAITVKGRNW